jgi:hypothetical protein
MPDQHSICYKNGPELPELRDHHGVATPEEQMRMAIKAAVRGQRAHQDDQYVDKFDVKLANADALDARWAWELLERKGYPPWKHHEQQAKEAHLRLQKFMKEIKELPTKALQQQCADQETERFENAEMIRRELTEMRLKHLEQQAIKAGDKDEEYLVTRTHSGPIRHVRPDWRKEAMELVRDVALQRGQLNDYNRSRVAAAIDAARVEQYTRDKAGADAAGQVPPAVAWTTPGRNPREVNSLSEILRYMQARRGGRRTHKKRPKQRKHEKRPKQRKMTKTKKNKKIRKTRKSRKH